MADNKKNQKIIDSYDYLANAASTQDCTGLIPAAPTSKAELESYEDIYHYEPPKVKVKTPDSEHQNSHCSLLMVHIPIFLIYL